MKICDFSFMYPNRVDRQFSESVGFSDTVRDLGLDTLLACRTSDISRYLTSDAAVISQRCALFTDLAECDGLYDLFVYMRECLRNANDIICAFSAETNEANLYSVKQLELYVDFIRRTHEGLERIRHTLSSERLKVFADIIGETYRSDSFTTLCSQIEKMLLSVANIKSVTVGFNLNAQLEPYEGGLLSVNTEYIRSGNIVDRLLSGDVKTDEMTALCPLTPNKKIMTKHEYDVASTVFSDAMKKSLRSGIGKWQGLVKAYLSGELNDYIALLPELEYILFGASVVSKLKEKSLPLCRPTLYPKEEGVCRLRGFYNPVTALAGKEAKQVKNDFAFDHQGRVYICTGPNGGGKSVFTRAVGIVYLFCQMGLPVPAETADISPVDRIITVFPNKAHGLSADGGRFEEECVRIRQVFSIITSQSLILLDEALSSTGAYEGALIAKELVVALGRIGAKGIFTTHMHALVDMIDEMNASLPEGGIDAITAEVSGTRRTFRITRRRGDKKSYARDIAERYGISEEKLLQLNASEGKSASYESE